MNNSQKKEFELKPSCSFLLTILMSIAVLGSGLSLLQNQYIITIILFATVIILCLAFALRKTLKIEKNKIIKKNLFRENIINFQDIKKISIKAIPFYLGSAKVAALEIHFKNKVTIVDITTSYKHKDTKRFIEVLKKNFGKKFREE